MMLFGPEHHRERGDRGGEAALAVLAQQDVLAQDLVHAVLVLALAAVERMVLGDRQQIRRRIDDGGAREHVVPGAPAQQLAHQLRVLGAIGADVEHAVPVAARERRAQCGRIGAVGDQARDAARQLGRGLAAVAHAHVVSGAHELAHEREPVELRAAHHERLIVPPHGLRSPAARCAKLGPAFTQLGEERLELLGLAHECEQPELDVGGA